MAESKKVIIDIRLLTKGGTSGIEEYTRSLIGAMLAGDRDSEFTLFYNGFRKLPLPEEWSLARNVKIINTRIPNKILDISARFFGEPRVERFINGDIVFSPHFNILATSLPHVITFHDLSFRHHPDFFLRRQHIWHWLQNCKREAEKAAKIIAVSEFTKSDLVELFKIPKEKIKVIYSGIDAAFTKINAEDPRLEFIKDKYKLRRPFILYLGTIEPRKNVLGIVRAFDALKQADGFKDIELIIAGPRGWLFKETLKEAGRSRFAKDVRFLGRINSAERVFFYNLASAFVYPSFFEGFGFPPLEAQACGLPVVASNRTSLPEILDNSAALVDPWNIDEIYMGMKKILTDGNYRSTLAGLGLANAKKFTWKKAAEETAKVYYN